MRNTAFRTLAVVCACGTLTACRSQPDPRAPSAVEPAEASYVIVGSTAGAPSACSASLIAARASDLFRLISRRDVSAAAALFGIDRPDVPFAWMSFNDRASSVEFTVRESADTLAYRLSTLNAAEITLRGIDVTGWVASRQSVGLLLFFEYVGITANSTERRFGFGKAEFHCPSGTFLVMSLSRQPESTWRKLYDGHLGPQRPR